MDFSGFFENSLAGIGRFQAGIGSSVIAVSEKDGNPPQEGAHRPAAAGAAPRSDEQGEICDSPATFLSTAKLSRECNKNTKNQVTGLNL